MFIVKLQCTHCPFSTEAFTDGYNIVDDTYTNIYRNLKTNDIRIVRVTTQELQQRHIEPKSEHFYATFTQTFAGENEVEIPLTSWWDDEEVAVVCPQCGAHGLVKHIIGIA